MHGTSTSQEHRIRQRILESGIRILGRDGLTPHLLEDATRAAGFRPEQAQPFFHKDEDLVWSLYLRLASDLEARVPELPAGTIAERFREVMLAKLELVAPYRAALTSLLGALANPRHELGVLHPQTEMVRLRGISVMSAVVQGATDSPKEGAESLAHSLYAAHLALMLLWSQDRSSDAAGTRAAIDRACRVLDRSRPLLDSRNVQTILAGADALFSRWIAPRADSPTAEMAAKVLRILFKHRRLLAGAADCAANPCEACLALHLPKVRRAVAAGEPVHLVLPAFPAKSPSPQKALGTLPDKAEEIALRTLEAICGEIGKAYTPGARLTICSDGHVFSDLVGVPDDIVSAYGRAIAIMIRDLRLQSIDTFNMGDVFDGVDYEWMRRQLCLHYAEDEGVIAARIHTHPHQQALFNGIHRFLFEDLCGVEPERSRTQVRKESKANAYAVIRRSDAWGRLITECFPKSLRLSIHPQPPHSDKIGILLGPSRDVWLTPWHGCAVERNGYFTLMPRAAVSAGARVVEQDGRPYYLEVEEDP